MCRFRYSRRRQGFRAVRAGLLISFLTSVASFAAAYSTNAGVAGYALRFGGYEWASVSWYSPEEELYVDQRTLEAWVYRESGYGDWEELFTGTGYPPFVLRVLQDGSLQVQITTTVGPTELSTPPGSIPFNTWTHVAFSWDGSILRAYVNGVERASYPLGGYFLNRLETLRVGTSSQYGVWGWRGVIDEIRLWNVARSPSEILDSSGTILLGSEPGLVAYWRFDEGDGQWAEDSGANQIRLRLGRYASEDNKDPEWIVSGAPLSPPSRGRIILERNLVSCSDTLDVRLQDAGLIGEPAWPILVSSNSGDLETLVLDSLVAAPEMFEGTASIVTGVPVPLDGYLQVAHGDFISVSYEDMDDGTGTPAVIEATAAVECLPAVITGLSVSEAGPFQTQISFETNEETIAIVRFGGDCANLAETASYDQWTWSHKVLLTDLEPDVVYSFVVEVLDRAGNKTTDNNGGECYRFVSPGYPSPPFSDGFEEGTFGPAWEITGIGAYRTRVKSDFGPHSGAYHLLMDASTSGQSYARNEATLHLDMRGSREAILRFFAREYNDSPHGPPPSPFRYGANFDGAAVSEDGIEWYEVQSLRGLTDVYQEYLIDLDRVTHDLGLQYTKDFRIRFNQYGDRPVPDSGIAVDDVSVVFGAGTKGSIAFDRDFYTCSNAAQIALLDSSLADSATATVAVGSGSGDSERVTLVGHATVPGRFDGSIQLAEGSAVPEDGILQVAPDDVLSATYEDADDGTGISDISTATAEVDCLNPVISGLEITGIRAVDAFADIKVNEPAQAVIRVGTSCENLDMEFSSEVLSEVHRFHLVGLVPETRYFADLELEDRAGNRTSFSSTGTCAIFETRGFPQPSFFDDFELPRSETQWFFTGTNDFRIRTTSRYGPANGSYHLVMDDAVHESGQSRNEATVILDLQDWEEVVLSFQAREYIEEPDGPPPSPFTDGADFDGLAVSVDGVTWYGIWNLLNLSYYYEEIRLFLDPIVESLGLGYSRTFHIRFNQFGSEPVTGDGIALDDVRVTAVPADDLEVIPFDRTVFTGPATGPFRSISDVFSLVNEGTQTLTWAVGTNDDWLEFTPAGGSLASGATGEVSIRVGAAAEMLPIGRHVALLRFTNLSTGNSREREVLLVITEGQDRGLYFPGDHRAVSEAHPDLNMTQREGFTLECSFVRRSVGWNDDQTLFSKGGYPASYALFITPEGAVKLAISTSSGTERLSTRDGVIPFDIWYHVAAGCDDSFMRIYVDGVESASAAYSGSFIDTDGGLVVGGFRSIIGVLDEIRIWNIARSAAEIEAYHDLSLDGDEAGLVALWKLDEGLGQFSWDSTANGICLRLGTTEFEDRSDPLWVRVMKGRIEPARPNTGDDLTCVVSPPPDDLPDLDVNYRWFRNRVEITEPVGHDGQVFFPDAPTLSRHFTARNGRFFSRVMFPGDPLYMIDTRPVIVVNSLPGPAAVHISPRNPSADDGLTAVIDRQSTDMDGDAIGYEIRWYVSRDGGNTFEFLPFLSGSPPIALWVPPGYLLEGDIWRLEVLAYEVNDPDIEGETAWDEVYVGANQSPWVQIIEPGPDNVIAYPSAAVRWVAQDPDGDAVTVDIYYDLDTVEGEAVLIAEDRPAEGMIYWTPPGLPPETGSSDVDNDGFITADDLFLFAARWGAEPPDGRYRIFARARDEKGALGEAFSPGEIIVPKEVPGTREVLLRMMGEWGGSEP